MQRFSFRYLKSISFNTFRGSGCLGDIRNRCSLQQLGWMSSSSQKEKSKDTEREIGAKITVEASPYRMYYPEFKIELFGTLKSTEKSQALAKIQTALEDGGSRDQHARAGGGTPSAGDPVLDSSYDLIIHCDKLLDLNSHGWKITLDKENDLWYGTDKGGHKRFQPEKKNGVKTVAVTGPFNTGKTFVLNNLCKNDTSLPSGDAIRTEGISMKKLRSSNDMLVIDTAGASSRIKMTNDDDIDLSDKISSEKILESTVFDTANYHICVLNKLTWPDQHHFEMKYQKIRDSMDESGSKCVQDLPLYIVHNYRDHKLQDLPGLVRDIEMAYPKGQFRCSDLTDDPNQIKEQFLQQIEEYLNHDDDITSKETDEDHSALARNIYNVIHPIYVRQAGSMGTKFMSKREDREREVENIRSWDVVSQITDKIRSHHETKSSNEHVKETFQKKVKEIQAKFVDKSFWYDSKGDNTTIHLFLVNNASSPAAQAYNWNVFHHIRRELQTKQLKKENQFSLKNVFDSLDSHISHYAKFQVQGSYSEFEYAQPVTEPKLGVIGKTKQDDDYRVLLHPTLLAQNARIKLKKSSELEYNALLIGATSWKPKYDVHYSGNNVCSVWMEIPGVIQDAKAYVEDSLSSEDGKTYLIVKGRREQEEGYPKQFGVHDKVERPFRDFEFRVSLKKQFTEVIKRERKEGVLFVQIVPQTRPAEEDQSF